MLNEIFNAVFVLNSLAIFAVVFVIRKCSEYFKVQKYRLWRELVLPVLPIIMGVCFSLIDNLSGNNNVSITMGLVSGLFSAHLYKIIKGIIKPHMDKQT